jgi:hypothetical protein
LEQPLEQAQVKIEKVGVWRFEEMLKGIAVVFKVRRITVGGLNTAPVLERPIVVWCDLNGADGCLLVFAFMERDTESLRPIGSGDMTAVAPAAFLIMFARFEAYDRKPPNQCAPADGRQVGEFDQYLIRHRVAGWFGARGFSFSSFFVPLLPRL